MKDRHIAVFCASTPGEPKRDHYLGLAYAFGYALGKNGFACVNGGCGGMMKTLSEGAKAGGGQVHCVNLSAYPPDHDAYNTLESYAGLHDRQMALIAKGDAFVALPGGIGTLHEITEVISRKSLGEIPADLPLVLVGEEWQYLVQHIEFTLANGLIRDNPFDSTYVVSNIEVAINFLVKHFNK